jgi:tetratricopeptide (TPR) repeat protein
MKAKIFFLLSLMVCSNLLMIGQDAATNGNDDKKIHRIKMWHGEKGVERYRISTKANEYLNARDFSGAVDFLTKEISMLDVQDNDYVLHTSGYTFGLRGVAFYYLQDYDSALNDLNKAVEICPKWSDGYFMRGNVKYALEEYQPASADYKKAVELKPKAAGYLDALCICYSRAEDYPNAVKCYKKILARNSCNSYARDNLGYAYLATNDYPSAIINFKKCLELEPENVDVIFGLALAYYYQNDLANAAKYINQARELKPILTEGVAGFEKFKEEGWFYNEKDDAALKKMFLEFK